MQRQESIQKTANSVDSGKETKARKHEVAAQGAQPVPGRRRRARCPPWVNECWKWREAKTRSSTIRTYRYTSEILWTWFQTIAIKSLFLSLWFAVWKITLMQRLRHAGSALPFWRVQHHFRAQSRRDVRRRADWPR
uniref:Uncharacterized protein n=1 Tax=Myotis myotis TaxID=51298 RepID=A0A7J7R9U4_MYOMY|nr:hypothetical protein mMyoMyo1_010861 [Myotis myotis]